MSSTDKKIVRKTEHGTYIIMCPGCGDGHQIDSRWTFNGDMEKPTFSPSLLVTHRHPKGYSNENPAPLGYDGEYVEDRCHSFITDGMIKFLEDCTHDLRGQTVPLTAF